MSADDTLLGETDGVDDQPDVIETWLRFDDVLCGRCDRWAGPEGDIVYLVDGRMVCSGCVSHDEKRRAVRR